MKKAIYTAFAILFLINFQTHLFAQCNARSLNVFNSGESVRYKIYYNLSAVWAAAGEAVFSTKATTYDGKNAYHVVGTGSTYKSYDWIMKVRDRYESYIDATTFNPLRFKRDINEDNYKFQNDVTFNHASNKAYSKGKSYTIKDCTQDVISTIYYARNLDYDKFKAGEKILFSLFLDNELHDIYIRYMGKVTIKTKYGKFRAIKLKPLLIKGTIFKGGEKMVVYVSDDKNHIPLRVESPIIIGSVKVDLMSFKNLKYPLSSKIG